MRWLAIGVACVALTACSRGPNDSGAADDLSGNAVTGAAGIAFIYDYAFRLPSSRIANAQEAHAGACERLGPGRCRITGMTYRVDDAGAVSASLDVKLAAPIARGFGRAGVRAVEQAGGSLVGAEIGGTDAQPATAQAQADAGTADAADARIGRELARPGLPARERAALRRQQADIARQRGEAGDALAAAREGVATTPMHFSYRAGSGVGLSAKLADAWQTAIGSVGLTIGLALWLLAALGPPALLLLAGWLLWRFAGRRAWRRLAGAGGGVSVGVGGVC